MSAAPTLILRCACGASVAVPADTTGARAKCPKCAAEIPIATAHAGPAAIGSSCPVCQTVIEDGQDWSRCGGCGLVHHKECWLEVGGCGAYGCVCAPTKAPSDDRTQPLTAWGDTKKCPVCGETIKSIAVKCRFCETELGTIDPLSANEYMQRGDQAKRSEGFRTGIVVMFGASVIGIAAPLMLIISLIVVLGSREKLKAAGPVSVTLGYTALALSALYSLLMLIFLVGSF